MQAPGGDRGDMRGGRVLQSGRDDGLAVGVVAPGYESAVRLQSEAVQAARSNRGDVRGGRALQSGRDGGRAVAVVAPGYGQTTIPAGLSGVTAIAGGGNHSLALKSDGTVVA